MNYDIMHLLLDNDEFNIVPRGSSPLFAVGFTQWIGQS